MHYFRCITSLNIFTTNCCWICRWWISICRSTICRKTRDRPPFRPFPAPLGILPAEWRRLSAGLAWRTIRAIIDVHYPPPQSPIFGGKLSDFFIQLNWIVFREFHTLKKWVGTATWLRPITWYLTYIFPSFSFLFNIYSFIHYSHWIQFKKRAAANELKLPRQIQRSYQFKNSKTNYSDGLKKGRIKWNDQSYLYRRRRCGDFSSNCGRGVPARSTCRGWNLCPPVATCWTRERFANNPIVASGGFQRPLDGPGRIRSLCNLLERNRNELNRIGIWIEFE